MQRSYISKIMISFNNILTSEELDQFHAQN